MQLFTVFTTLRDEIAAAEYSATQAWERYHQALSNDALVQAVTTTQHIATLHRQMASRLEKVAGV